MTTSSYFIDIHNHQVHSLEPGQINIQNWMPVDLEFNPPKYYYSLGIHPSFIKNSWDLDLARIEKLIETDPKFLAVGEIGLDNFSTSSMKLQEEVFLAQILLAQKYHKPLIIHCVKAHEKLLSIIKFVKPSVPVIIHGFNQKWTLAQKLIEAGLYLSFGNALANPASNATICIKKMGLDGLFFLETDDKPIKIEKIYTLASLYLEIDMETLKVLVQSRFNSVFKP